MATNRPLSTASAIIDALGGNVPFLAIINQGVPLQEQRRTTHASNYRSTGRLPPDTFLIVMAALEQRGLTAPPSIWKIREPKKARVAA